MNQKRFISGAMCPSCGALDALYMYTHDERDRVQCADCDYSQHRPEPKPITGSRIALSNQESMAAGVFWRQAVDPAEDPKPR